MIATPVSLSAGFASTASYVVIAASDVLMALIGVALLREPVVAAEEFDCVPAGGRTK